MCDGEVTEVLTGCQGEANHKNVNLHMTTVCAKKPKKGDSSVRGGTSLVVQWLSPHTPRAGGLASIPDQERKSHMLQLRPSAAK